MNQTAVIPDPKSTDPFFYGFRDVVRHLPDGRVEYGIQPLTLEDVIHPQFGDKIVVGEYHPFLCEYLKNHLQQRLAHDKSARVYTDLGIFWDDEELGHHSPDISVIFGVRDKPFERPSFDVAEEGVRPSLLIEIVSPSTREADLGKKIEHYHRAGVPQYVIVDRKDGFPTRLLSYHHAPGDFVLDEPQEYGRVRLDCVNLWLEIRERRLVLVDAETGEDLKDSEELVRLAEEARLNAERIAREESRRAETEARRAETEARRAEAEARLAQAEARRADAAEQRLREMEEEIRKLRGNG